MHKVLTSRAWWIASFGFVHGPFLGWWAERLSGKADEWLHLVTLILLATTYTGRDFRKPLGQSEQGLWLAVHLLLAGLVAVLPPLLWGGLWVTSAILCSGWTSGSVGRWLLGLAALPTEQSLQFFLGYPLRRLTTEMAAWLLQGFGQPVEAIGAYLRGAEGAEVAVDSPCAGLHALWVSQVFVGYTLATIDRPLSRQLILGVGAFVAVLLANGARAAGLYAFLTGMWPTWPGYHDLTGLLAFVLWFGPWLLWVRAKTGGGHA